MLQLSVFDTLLRIVIHYCELSKHITDRNCGVMDTT